MKKERKVKESSTTISRKRTMNELSRKWMCSGTVVCSMSKVSEKPSPQGTGQEGWQEVGILSVCAAHPGTFQLCRCMQAGRVRNLTHLSGSG